jgi:hypothetical protein
MKIKPRSFPYPVLSKFSDDVRPNGFKVDLDVTSTKSAYLLDYVVSLEHDGLKELISSSTAALVIHVECQSNFHRNIYTTSEITGQVRIPVDRVTGRVEVTFLVVSNRDESSYRIDGIHDDYGDLSFEVGKSDLLALLETKYFIAEKDPNLLRKISSIIQVAPLPAGKEAWEIDLYGQKIYVKMPQKDMEKYYVLRDATKISAALNSTIVIPAIIEGLHYIRGTADSELEVEREHRWFSVLERKLKSLNIDVTDSGNSMFEIAQQIMEDPAPGTLNELEQLIETGE